MKKEKKSIYQKLNDIFFPLNSLVVNLAKKIEQENELNTGSRNKSSRRRHFES